MRITTNRDPDEVISELLEETRPFSEVIADKLKTRDRDILKRWLQLLLAVRVKEGHDLLIEAVSQAETVEIIGSFMMNPKTREVESVSDPHVLNDRVIAKLRAEKEQIKQGSE